MIKGKERNLDIIAILLSLVTLTNMYKNAREDKDKIQIMNNFIEEHKYVLDHYSEQFRILFEKKQVCHKE